MGIQPSQECSHSLFARRWGSVRALQNFWSRYSPSSSNYLGLPQLSLVHLLFRNPTLFFRTPCPQVGPGLSLGWGACFCLLEHLVCWQPAVRKAGNVPFSS